MHYAPSTFVYTAQNDFLKTTSTPLVGRGHPRPPPDATLLFHRLSHTPKVLVAMTTQLYPYQMISRESCRRLRRLRRRRFCWILFIGITRSTRPKTHRPRHRLHHVKTHIGRLLPPYIHTPKALYVYREE